MANKNTEKGLGSKGLRAYSPGAEVKYIGIRAGSSKTFYLNEVLDQMLLMALQKEYRNEQELEAILQLIGHMNALRLSFRLTATQEDMKRYYMMAQKNRYDKKFGLSKPNSHFFGFDPASFFYLCISLDYFTNNKLEIKTSLSEN